MISREEKTKLYIQVPCWRKTSELCPALLVPAILILAYASYVLLEESLRETALYRDEQTDHFIMVMIVFLYETHPEDNIIKLNIFGFDA